MIPAWVAPYIGLPYEEKGRTRAGADCWGGVRLVLAEVFGLQLPDYADAYTHTKDADSVAHAVTAGLADGWKRVEHASEGCLLILRIAGRPWHCALMVNDRQFLHWPPPDRQGKQQGSCIGRLDAPEWARRIEGIYSRAVAD